MKPVKDAGKKNVGFGDRLNNAAAAKKAQLERCRAKPGIDDPAFVERQAARQAVIAAREIREAERKAERQARAEQEAAEKAAKAESQAREAAEQAEREANEAAQAEADSIALAAQQKAARDARYAARKARK